VLGAREGELAEGVVAGCEFSGFGYCAGGVEVFGGVDVDEADSSGVGFFEIFVGEDRYRWVVGDGRLFDNPAWGCFAFGHGVCEVGDPLIAWIDGVERVEDAFGAGDYRRWVFDSIDSGGTCHGFDEVTGHERVITGYNEADWGG